MFIFLAIIGLTVGATALQLAPELAGEAVAMYIVEPADDGGYGASVNKNKTSDGLERNLVDPNESDAVFSRPTPILAVAASAQLSEIAYEVPTPATEATGAQKSEHNHGDEKNHDHAAHNHGDEENHDHGHDHSHDHSHDSKDLASKVQIALLQEKPTTNPDGTIFLPIAAQRIFEIRTVVGELSTVPIGAELPGRVIVNPSSSVLVQAAYRGTIQMVDGKYPFVGQQVGRGQLLATLKPVNSHLDEARVRERITELTNEIELDRKRMAMLNEVVYVRYRINKIEEVRTKIQGLIRRLKVLEDSLTQSYELRAQTDGVVSEVAVTAGQHVLEGATLFRVVDPSRLWVEASGYQQGLQNSVQSATALTVEGSKIDLKFVGGGLSLSNQAIPLLFEIVSTNADSLSVGKPVTVFVQSDNSKIEGVRVPRTSLVRGTDGSALIWKKVAAELFLKTRVSVTPIDAESVLISGDLSPKDRIVSAGVGLLAQIR
ncbi:efflux RND transporter periplasmic adaptor subunit [Gammaproteobacteria bacterium]|nr:efflux RND transporter periplasmic adaptor subunit [Gammaproteobacteria bacterium]